MDEKVYKNMFCFCAAGTDPRVRRVQACTGCFEEEGKIILVDYKSNFIRPDRPHEAELARIRDEYKVQIELYSEAIEKGAGMKVDEAYLYLFASGETIDMLQ